MATDDTKTPDDRKAAADARSAEIDAEKKQAEFDEWKELSAQRMADEAQKSLDLKLKNDEAQRTALKDMVPDLGSVTPGSLSVPDSKIAFDGLLSGQAIEDAAHQLIGVVKGAFPNGSVLVTTDLELAKRDASLVSLQAQLEDVADLLDRFDEPAPAPARGTNAFMGVASAAVMLAKLIPGVLSLISAKRTLSVTSSTVDDTTALMAVAGKIAGADSQATIVVEPTRLLDTSSGVYQAWAVLEQTCQLVEGKLNDIPDTNPKKVEGTALLRSCRDILTTAAATPDGGGYSALAGAAMQEVLHSDRFQGILIVKGNAASSTQLTSDRPLAFGDPINVVSTATISYLLIDHRQGSRVRAGGLALGTAQFTGKLGSKLEVPD